MTKQEFLDSLAEKLALLGPTESYKSVLYYSEMIADRVEDGMSEEAAVAAMGDPAKIAEEIMLSAPLPTLVKGKMEQKPKPNGYKIALIIVLSPIWAPCGLAAICVAAALVISLLALLISFFAVVVAMVCGGIAAMAVTPLCAGDGAVPVLIMVGGGALTAGLGLYLIPVAKQVALGCFRLFAAMLRGIKRIFIKKGRADQ